MSSVVSIEWAIPEKSKQRGGGGGGGVEDRKFPGVSRT